MLTMKFLLSLMLVLVACSASDPIFDDVSPQLIEEVLDNYRLPLDVIPSEYDIKLEPIFESNKDNFTFKGTSEITLNIMKETNTITFHAKEIIIEKNITLTYKNGKEMVNLSLSELKEDTNKDFVTLIFQKTIPKIENAKLFLKYTGKLNDELRGFYRSSYQNKEGKKIWLATTHFEPVGARRAFPCWDEPQFKAEFTITITVPQKDYKAISNMPGNSVSGKTIFKKTPKMSTYLVAFVVSDFTVRQNNENFGVWAKPTAEQNATEFAFEYGLKTLKTLIEFTNIDYYGEKQMHKLDQIAIPDLATSAMENWGLVTYRESLLFYVETKTTTEEKQAIATTIAHELSHQWFGNLVTCKWWNYVWLKEGFATFFQYYITDKVVPQLYENKESWRLMEQFVIKNVQESSFVVDASSKTRPLNPKTNAIQTTAQIQSLFDDIASKKGASILRMIQGFLSEDVFQEGLRKYLNDHKGKSVDSDNFFDSIVNSNNKKVEEYLPKDVTLKQVMENWVDKPGYPVITVTWNKKLPDVINITQERFFLVKPVKEDKTQWYIPINYVTEESPNEVMPTDKKSRWLIPGTNTLLDKLNDTKWILFNKDQTGFYRVNYDDSNWQKLASYLKSPYYANISTTNRAQLIDDALNLARTGYLAYKTALQITSYLSNETDYIPWYAAVRAFDYLDSVLLGGKNYTEYHKYVAEKIKTFTLKINYTNWENATHVDKLAKVLALNTACKYGLEDCNNFVNKKLTDWLDDKKKEDERKLLPDMRRGILCAGLRNANLQIWNDTLQKYKTTKDNDEKADILAGLGCATSKEIIQKFLSLTLEKNPDVNISNVDIFAAINSIYAGNIESFDILIEFINNNIETIHKADKEDGSLLSALLNKLSNRVVTTEQYIQLSLLIHGQSQAAQKLEALSAAIYKLAWIKTYRDDVEEWIVNNCEVCQNENEPSSASSITLMSLLLSTIISLLLTRTY